MLTVLASLVMSSALAAPDSNLGWVQPNQCVEITCSVAAGQQPAPPNAPLVGVLYIRGEFPTNPSATAICGAAYPYAPAGMTGTVTSNGSYDDGLDLEPSSPCLPPDQPYEPPPLVPMDPIEPPPLDGAPKDWPFDAELWGM